MSETKPNEYFVDGEQRENFMEVGKDLAGATAENLAAVTDDGVAGLPTIHECFSCVDADCGLNADHACGKTWLANL